MSTLELHRKSSIIWNGTYTIYYRCAYSVYLFLLYSVVEPKTFGIIGTFFSLIYLSKNFFELGLPQSYSPYFLEFSKSKHAFTTFFIQQALAHLILLILLFPIGGLYYWLILDATIIPTQPLMILLFFMIFVLECITNSLKKILRLALFYRQTALIEMCAISLFLGLLIIGILCKHILTSAFVFGCFFVHSLFSLSCLGYIMAHWYRKLPNTDASQTFLSIKSLILLRAMSFMTNLGNIVFSSNFLVPLIASRQGFEVIAYYKLISNAAHTLDLFLEHTFGQTSESILSNIERSMDFYQQKVFKQLSQNIFHIIFALFIFFAINHAQFLSLLIPSMNQELSHALFLYFFILLNNSLFSTYKSLYTINQNFTFFAVVKLCMTATTFALIFYTGALSLVMILATMLIAQILALISIASGAYYFWDISFPAGMSLIQFVSYIILSLMIFFIL